MTPDPVGLTLAVGGGLIVAGCLAIAGTWLAKGAIVAIGMVARWRRSLWWTRGHLGMGEWRPRNPRGAQGEAIRGRDVRSD